MRKILILGLIACLPASAFGQEKKEPGPVKVIDLKRKDPVSYDKEIEPIFYKRCVVCHSGKDKEGRFDLSSYDLLIKGGKSGKEFDPGNSGTSRLHAMIARTRDPAMPPKEEEPVTPEELALIKLWIDQGGRAPTGPSIVRPRIVVNAPPPPNVNPVRALAVSPDKSTVAAGRGNQIHIYDAGSGAHIRTLLDPQLSTPDGKEVKAAHLSIVESMAYSPDGKYLVSGGFQEAAVWDIQTGQLRQRIPGFAHAVVAVAFSPDSKLFGAAGGEPTAEGEIKVFEVGTWKKIMDIKNGHSDTVYGITFSPEIKMPVPGGDKDKFEMVKFIATASADKFVKVWEIPTGKFVKSFEGHTHHVLDVGWTSDGKLLASAGGDNTVKIWDFEKGEQVRTINAHGKQVTRLSFIGKKAEFVTCGGDGQVKFFNAQNGGNLRNFSGGADFIYGIGVSPDGAVVASGGQDGIVRVFNGNTGALTRELVPPGVTLPKKQ